MKNATLWVFSFLIFLASSCKKTVDSPNPLNPASSLLKSIIYTDTTGKFIASISFQYDSHARILQMIFDNPPTSDSLVHNYEYYPEMVVEKVFYANNIKYGRTVYYLNSAGMATSETDIGYSQNGDSSVAQSVTYKYIDGYMTEKKTYLHGDTATWIAMNWQYLSGNNSSMSLGLSLWGSGNVTETYDFYTNSVNTIGNSNSGKLFLGKSSKNLIKSSLTNNLPPKSGTYTYNFDLMNRVIQQFIRGDGLSTSNVNILYTYY